MGTRCTALTRKTSCLEQWPTMELLTFATQKKNVDSIISNHREQVLVCNVVAVVVVVVVVVEGI